MANYNHVMLVGNVTRDPEIKYTADGTAIAAIGLAVNRVGKDKNGDKTEETTFVDITLWSNTAEIVGKYVKKGDPLLVEGRLKMDTWEDKNTGQKRSKLHVVGQNIQLMGRKADSSESPTPSKVPAKSSGHPTSRLTDPDLDPAQDPDDIPFRTRIYKDVRNSKLNSRVF